MPSTSLRRLAQAGLILSIPLLAASCPGARADLSDITLPAGFKIAYYAQGVTGARSLAISPGGTVFVGTRNTGKVYALRDDDGDDRAERVITIASGLNQPNGVAFHDGDLYVAEATRVIRYDDIDTRLDNPPAPAVVYDQFPAQDSHEWKYMAFGPDGLLYVPVGAPCNVCEPAAPVDASITRMNPNGTGFEIFATGIRNTVGFDWHPDTGVLWFTDNGRDHMGDNQPPDELNRAAEAGLHFGFPYCHGTGIQDPDFTGRNCDEFEAPEINLGPHVAALGMRFYTGTMFPESYRKQVFIAEHGSWNRSVPIGYRVMLVRLNEAGDAVSYETFAEGWLQGRTAWGRPVDVLVMPDGALLVSDDKLGAVYRISFGE